MVVVCPRNTAFLDAHDRAVEALGVKADHGIAVIPDGESTFHLNLVDVSSRDARQTPVCGSARHVGRGDILKTVSQLMVDAEVDQQVPIVLLEAPNDENYRMKWVLVDIGSLMPLLGGGIEAAFNPV